MNSDPLVDVVTGSRTVAVRRSEAHKWPSYVQVLVEAEPPARRPRNYWAEALTGLTTAFALAALVFGPRIMAPAFAVAAFGLWFLYVRGT